MRVGPITGLPSGQEGWLATPLTQACRGKMRGRSCGLDATPPAQTLPPIQGDVEKLLHIQVMLGEGGGGVAKRTIKVRLTSMVNWG